MAKILHGSKDSGISCRWSRLQPEVSGYPDRTRLPGGRGQRGKPGPGRSAGGILTRGDYNVLCNCMLLTGRLGLPVGGLHRGAAADKGAQLVLPDGRAGERGCIPGKDHLLLSGLPVA